MANRKSIRSEVTLPLFGPAAFRPPRQANYLWRYRLPREVNRRGNPAAVEDPAHPWPVIPGKGQSAGPTYVIWIGEGADSIRAGLWPYQAASIAEVLSPVVRWPQLAASSSLSEGDAGREGQDLFFAHCLVCH
jgi:hypothetical protein